MKIGINLLSVVPGDVGGAEIYINNLIENIIRLDKTNQYFLFATQNNFSNYKYKNSNVKLIITKINNQNRYKRVLYEQFIFPFKVNKYKLDYLISPTGTSPLFFNNFQNIIIIQSLHSFLYPQEIPFIRRVYLNNLIKVSCKLAKGIICVSKDCANDLLEIIKINELKVQVILEGVDLSFFIKNKDLDFYKKYNLIDQKYIFSPISLLPYKNWNRLIKAFKLFKEKNKSFKLVIAGSDWFGGKYNLTKLIRDLNLEKDVLYLGLIPFNEIPSLYHHAKMVIYPSLKETFGLPVLEAMVCDVPVIASNTSSIPEVAGDAALLINPLKTDEISKAMNNLVKSNELAKILILKGRENIKRFDWKICAKKLIDYLTELNKK